MQQLHATRQQLLRLVALTQWVPKARALAELVGEGKVLDCAAHHARALQSAVDDAIAGHQERAARFNPMFDVQAALAVLETGDDEL